MRTRIVQFVQILLILQFNQFTARYCLYLFPMERRYLKKFQVLYWAI